MTDLKVGYVPNEVYKVEQFGNTFRFVRWGIIFFKQSSFRTINNWFMHYNCFNCLIAKNWQKLKLNKLVFEVNTNLGLYSMIKNMRE